MRVSLTLDDVKKIIAEKFEVSQDSIANHCDKKLFFKCKDDDTYELLETHLIFEFDKNMCNDTKVSKWGKK